MPEFSNNYIIGLGGTGGGALAAFRRSKVLRHQEYQSLLAAGARFEYLYIDSSEEDTYEARIKEEEDKQDGKDNKTQEKAKEESIWYVPGAEIRLTSSEVVWLDGTGFSKEEAKNRPNIRPWFGDIDGSVKGSHTAFGNATIKGAGQRRRYGRMLFARNQQTLVEALTNGIDRLTRNNTTDARSIYFHVFASLGGGTGSGSIVDVVTLIHDRCPHLQANINLYLFVAGNHPSVQLANVNYFYENEYAALQDLNALMCNRYRPEKAGHPKGDPHDKEDPIMSVYISSDACDLPRPIKEQTECMANACFDVIAAMRSGAGGNLTRSFNGEDLLPTNPGEATNMSDALQPIQHGVTAHPERSYRFQTLGISRCKEPVMEIRSILADKLAEQVYDRWCNGAIEDRTNRVCEATAEINADIYDALYGGKILMPNGGLESSCIKYEEKILKDFREKFSQEDSEFGPGTLEDITSYVRDVIARVRTDTVNDLTVCSGMRTPWQKLCATEAMEILRKVKANLETRRQWSVEHPPKVQVWGIANIVAYLDSMQTRLKPLPEGIQITESLGNMPARETEWKKLCGLTELLFTKNASLFDLHLKEAEAVITRVLNERRQAMRQNVETCLASNLKTLRQQMSAINQQLLDARDKFKEEVGAQLERLNTAVPDVVLLFNREKLQRHLNFLESPQAEEQIAESMRSFEALRMNAETVELEIGYPILELDEIEKTPSFWSESMRIHDAQVKTYPEDYKAAYHQTIYHALADQRSVNAYIHQMCALGNTLAGVNPGALGGSGIIKDYTAPIKAVAIGLPPSANGNQDSQKVKKQVEKTLEEELGGFASARIRYNLYTHADSHEIRIMKNLYWMPMRFLTVCAYLQKKADAVFHINDEDTKRATLYFSHIDDKEEQKPTLVPISAASPQIDVQKKFELAKHLYLPAGNGVAEPLMLAEELGEREPEPRLRLLTVAGMRNGLLNMEAYDSHQLDNSSEAFESHLDEILNLWAERCVTPAECRKVYDSLRETYNRYSKSEKQTQRAKADIVLSVIDEFEKKYRTYLAS